MTTQLRNRMIEDMQLRGMSKKTQDSYVRSVRKLAEHYHKSPNLITEEELSRYLKKGSFVLQSCVNFLVESAP